MVHEKGSGCLLFKRDLQRTYKQLLLSPNHWPFCGIEWQGKLYIYVSEIFGLRSSALACQRTTNCVTHLFSRDGYSACNYLDDIGGCDSPQRAGLAYETLGLLLQALGLKENTAKAVPSCTCMTFLGIIKNFEHYVHSRVEDSYTSAILAHNRFIVIRCIQ